MTRLALMTRVRIPLNNTTHKYLCIAHILAISRTRSDPISYVEGAQHRSLPCFTRRHASHTDSSPDDGERAPARPFLAWTERGSLVDASARPLAPTLLLFLARNLLSEGPLRQLLLDSRLEQRPVTGSLTHFRRRSAPTCATIERASEVLYRSNYHHTCTPHVRPARAHDQADKRSPDPTIPTIGVLTQVSPHCDDGALDGWRMLVRRVTAINTSKLSNERYGKSRQTYLWDMIFTQCHVVATSRARAQHSALPIIQMGADI